LSTSFSASVLDGCVQMLSRSSLAVTSCLIASAMRLMTSCASIASTSASASRSATDAVNRCCGSSSARRSDAAESPGEGLAALAPADHEHVHVHVQACHV